LSNHEYSCTGEHRGDFWAFAFLKSAAELPAYLTDRAAEFQVNDEGYLVWVGPGNTYQDGIAKQLWGTSLQAGGRTFNWGEPIQLMEANGLAAFRKFGSSLPDLNFGFTPDLRWKNLSIYAELRGQLGGVIYNEAKQTLYDQLRHKDVDQTGKPDGLKKSIEYYRRGLDVGDFNERFFESGTYLKVGALSARYRFDRAQLSRLLRAAAPQTLTLGVTGRNIATFTGYSGFDPEAGRALSRVETLGYPQLRTLTLTFDITF
jgi:hypothetical protein